MNLEVFDLDNKFSGPFQSRLKIIACILFVIFIGLINYIPGLSMALFIVLTALVLFKLKYKTPIKSLFFIILFASILASIQSITIGQNFLLKIDMFFFTINVYKEGLNIGIITFLRITNSMGAILLLIRSIKINEFQSVLEWMRVPKLFLEIMMFAIKYIYIFKEEATSVIKAQRSRLGYKGFYKSVISMSSVAGIVLTRAYDRSKVLAKSMQSRGYDGNT
jgi:cobalt ECF transporter T component CbiQ